MRTAGPTERRRALAAGAVLGGLAAATWFGLWCFLGTLPAVSDVSLSTSFRPWWRLGNWVSTLVVFVFVGGLVCLLRLLRLPPRRPYD